MVKVAGRTEFVAHLRRSAGPDMKRSIGRALFAAGQLVEAEAGRLITEGAVSGAAHVPSAPGEPPNNDTGVLARNIETLQEGQLKVTVSSNASYSQPLEFGSSRMAARPFMTPAVAAKKDEADKLIEDAINHVNAGGTIR